MNLSKIVLALALAMGTTAAAAEPLTNSNLTTGWVEVEDANTYFLSGEYVADNNFFVGGGYAWGDTDGYGDVNIFNFNMGAYLPIAQTKAGRGRTYGKIGVGYSDVANDYNDFQVVSASAGIYWENINWRLGTGVAAETSDIWDGFGYTDYTISALAAYKFDEGRWEVGTTTTFGDVDTFGLQVRYNFL